MNNSSVVYFSKKGMHFLKLNTRSFLLKVRIEPWMSAEMSDFMKIGTLLYTLSKTYFSRAFKNYCKIRNKVQSKINTAKANYFSNKIEEIKYV